MNCNGVSQRHFVQLTEIVVHLLVVEPNGDLRFLQIDPGNLPDIAIEHVFDRSCSASG